MSKKNGNKSTQDLNKDIDSVLEENAIPASFSKKQNLKPMLSPVYDENEVDTPDVIEQLSLGSASQLFKNGNPQQEKIINDLEKIVRTVFFPLNCFYL